VSDYGLEVLVPGTPIPQGSKRAIMSRSTQRPIVVDANRVGLAEWRADLTAYLMREAGEQGWPTQVNPVNVRIVFTLPRPAGHYLPANGKRSVPVLRADAPYWHTKAPDIDKLTRAVLDAMTDSHVVKDDSLVVGLRVTKVYGDHPGAHLRITPASLP
jgi:Holliday junction resolvase RusA-like endonuclease